MKKIEYGIIHSSYTPAGSNIRAADIDRWHKAPPRNWRMIGYHRVVCLDGMVEQGRPLDCDHFLEPFEQGAHAYGLNDRSVGICLIGGKAENGEHVFNFNDLQINALKKELLDLICQAPGIKFAGHRQVNSTSCPGFDVPEFLETLGIPKKNIEYDEKIKF